MSHIFEEGLERRAANHVPLTPVDFISRAAEVYGDRLAVVHGEIRRTWRETYDRTRQLAHALSLAGVQRGDTVAVLLPNIPQMIEAHFGVPMLGAVLNALNTRLDIASTLFMLRHGEAKVLIVDTEYAELAHRASLEFPNLRIISVSDVMPANAEQFPRATDYEAFLAQGDPQFEWSPPTDEWDAIALNYTSGTTGDPKGVVYHHRGAYPECGEQHPRMGHAQACGLSLDACPCFIAMAGAFRGRWRRERASMYACANSMRNSSST